MPLSFAESEDGVLLMANGIDPMLRWDGYAAEASPAGIAPPRLAPGMIAEGEGGISGEYYGFMRYVDDQGRRSNPTPFAGPLVMLNNGSIRYTNLDRPIESGQERVVRRQILRNTAGQTSVFYVDIDTGDLSSDHLSSGRVDEELSTQEAQALFATDGTALFNRFGPPPDHLSVVAFHLNRMFGAALQDYAEGSCRVTFGQDRVVGTATRWTPQMRGRFLHVGGGGPMEIAAVDVDRQQLTLTQPYAGPSDPFAAYGIRGTPDVADTIFYSEANQPEAWPADNAFTVRTDGDAITALIPLNSFLFIAKRRRMFRFSADADPRVDGFVFDSVDRGCVNHRAWVRAGDVVYVLDEQGVYQFDGRSAEELSIPIQDLFRGHNQDGLRINWACARFFHAVASPHESVVRFFVTINGNYLPRWALCYAYDRQRWWLEHYPYPIGDSCYGRIGRPTSGWTRTADQVYLAGGHQRVFASGGPLDGVSGWRPELGRRLRFATALRLGLEATLGHELVGSPISVVDGRGAGQRRIIVEVQGDQVVLDRPLLILPEAGDRYCVGGIDYLWRSHHLHLVESEEYTEMSVELTFQPQRWGGLELRRYNDYNARPESLARDWGPGDADYLSGRRGDQGLWVAMDNPLGFVLVNAGRHRERNTPGQRLVRIELQGTSGASRHVINQLKVDGVG